MASDMLETLRDINAELPVLIEKVDESRPLVRQAQGYWLQMPLLNFTQAQFADAIFRYERQIIRLKRDRAHVTCLAESIRGELSKSGTDLLEPTYRAIVASQQVLLDRRFVLDNAIDMAEKVLKELRKQFQYLANQEKIDQNNRDLAERLVESLFTVNPKLKEIDLSCLVISFPLLMDEIYKAYRVVQPKYATSKSRASKRRKGGGQALKAPTHTGEPDVTQARPIGELSDPELPLRSDQFTGTHSWVDMPLPDDKPAAGLFDDIGESG